MADSKEEKSQRKTDLTQGWSPEPWIDCPDFDEMDGAVICINTEKGLVEIGSFWSSGEDEWDNKAALLSLANLKRAVLCVNACAGLSNAALEEMIRVRDEGGYVTKFVYAAPGVFGPTDEEKK